MRQGMLDIKQEYQLIVNCLWHSMGGGVLSGELIVMIQVFCLGGGPLGGLCVMGYLWVFFGRYLDIV